MNYSKIQKAVGPLLVAASLVAASTSQGAEFWLKAGTTTKIMPGSSPTVTMWGFALATGDPASGGTYGPTTVPGPQLNVTAGDTTLTIHLANTLPEPVSIIIPGQYGSTAAGQATPHDSPAYAGRTRSLTVEAAPSSTQDFTWNNVQAGTFLYHSGSHPSVQVQMGLYGALTVLAAANVAYTDVPFDSSVTLLFSEIDPDVHDAVAGNPTTGSPPTFGPGPGFLPSDFTEAQAQSLIDKINASTDPVAHLLNHQAKAKAVLSSDKVATLTITDSGLGYDPAAPPIVTISPPTAGTPATAHTVVDPSGTVVTAILIDDSGSGYTTPPAVVIAPPISTGAAGLIANLNALMGGSSIYDPALFPDSLISQATKDLLIQAPEVNQPLSGVPFNGNMVRLNRMLLQEGLANAGITLPLVNKMTSTIRSYPQYFLVNGQAYDASAGNNVFSAGSVGSRVLLRMLNAGMDAHVPTLQNAGDLQLVAEDGQKSPYVRNTYSVWLPALKTVDAIFVPPISPDVNPCVATSERFPIYDRRLGLVNGTNPGGGMLAYLNVAVPAPTAVSGITVSPVDPSVQDGTPVTLTATVTGGYSGIAYTWKKNGTVVGGSGPTLNFVATYGETLNPAIYTVTVTDCSGTPFSPAATASVTVTPAPPKVTVNPAILAVNDGDSASFTATATGVGSLSYAWTKSPSVTVIATTPALSFAPASPSDSGTYTVTVTDGTTLLTGSASGQLTVSPVAASIVIAPAAQTTCSGAPATFSVTAAGTLPITYIWESASSPSSSTWTTEATHATSSRTDTFTVLSPTSSRSYRVTVSNALGAQTSDNAGARLTVSTPTNPNITTQPLSQTVLLGAPVTFSVTATATCSGGAVSDPLSYQWQKSPLSGTPSFSSISGATGPTYTILATVAGDAARYRVLVRNSAGQPTSSSSAASSTATLTLILPPTVTAPQSFTVFQGSNVTFTVTASGTGPFTYQWSKADVGTIAGATASSLPITVSSVDTSDAGNYTVTVTGLGGSATSSATAGGLTVVTQPPVKTVVASPSSVSFAVTAAGPGAGSVSYQWRRASTAAGTYSSLSDGTSGGRVTSGTTTATLNITNPTTAANGGWYAVRLGGIGAPQSTPVQYP